MHNIFIHKDYRLEIILTMKKYLLFSMLLLISSILFMSFSYSIKEELNLSTNIFLFSYLPNILPFILTINIFLKYVDLVQLSLYLKNKKLSVLFDILIIFLSLISGIPGCGLIINHLYENGIYSKEKSNKIIYHFSYISLPFIYSITSKNYTIIFLLILTSSLFYLLDNNVPNTYLKNNKTLSFDIISKTCYSLSSIYIFLSIAVILLIPFKNYKNPYIYLLLSFFETTFASIQLINNNYLLLSIFSMTFTSFSLLYQLKKVYIHFSISKYIKKRLIASLIITVLYFIFS